MRNTAHSKSPPGTRSQPCSWSGLVWSGLLGSARLGSARLGSARLGSARLGSARLGSARLGQSTRIAVALSSTIGVRTQLAKAAVRTDNLPLAVSVILFTVFGLSLGDALVKLTSSDFVIWQIFVTRSAIAIPCLVIYLTFNARSSLRMPTALSWTVVRSVLLVVMWLSYYVSLTKVSLSVAAAAYYTLPIFITLFSAAIAGERVSGLGWLSVFLGFFGVVLILKPNAADFSWYALLPLISAILYALAMILTRTKCRSTHPLILSLALNICFVVIGSIAAISIVSLPIESRHGFLLAPWAAMGTYQWLAMALLAMSLLIGSIGAAIAYQNAPSSVIGIFDFAYVGFAVMWGVLFFSETLDMATVSGIVIIVVAGILSLRPRQ